MTKADLVKAVAAAAGLTNKQASMAVQAMLDAVVDALKKGDTVSLTGFGRFSVKARAARKGINPQTLQPIQIPARNVPAFKAGKALKEAVK